MRISPKWSVACLAAGVTAGLLTLPFASSEEPSRSPAEETGYVLAYAEPKAAPEAQSAAEAQAAAVDHEVIVFRVQKGDTLAVLLGTAGIEPSEADRAIRAIREVFDPKTLMVGQEVSVSYLRETAGPDEASLQLVTIWLGAESYIEAIRTDDGAFLARWTNEPSAAEEPLDLSAFTRIRVSKGDTLGSLLGEAGADAQAIDRAVRALQHLFNPRKLRVDQEIFLSLGGAGSATELLGFSLKLAERKFITVVKNPDGSYRARRTNQPTLPKAGKTAPSPEPEELDLARSREETAGESAPGTVPDPIRAFISSQRPIGALALPGFPFREVVARADGVASMTKTLAIRKGDTLMNALLRAGCLPAEAHDAITAFSEVMNPRKLQAGQYLTLAFDPGGADGEALHLASLTLELAPDREVQVVRSQDGSFSGREIEKPLEYDRTRAKGTIETSLYKAAVDAGMPVSVLMEMIRMFSFDVDFQREIQPRDSFEVMFERAYTTDGEIVREGPVHYAALTLSGTTLALFRFEMDDGRVDYFNAKGHSVRKTLMRTPIDGARLSSTYGMRKHPILGYSRMHRGVDFAAPKGTSIMAAGDGVIVSLGWHGGHGKYIRIRHNSTYSTTYGHLSGYASGLQKGRRVEQGQVIGFVGSTGQSTGPHLHYEVLVDGDQVNPLSIKLPTGEKLAGAELDRFQARRERILTELYELPATTQIARSGADN